MGPWGQVCIKSFFGHGISCLRISAPAGNAASWSLSFTFLTMGRSETKEPAEGGNPLFLGAEDAETFLLQIILHIPLPLSNFLMVTGC